MVPRSWSTTPCPEWSRRCRPIASRPTWGLVADRHRHRRGLDGLRRGLARPIRPAAGRLDRALTWVIPGVSLALVTALVVYGEALTGTPRSRPARTSTTSRDASSCPSFRSSCSSRSHRSAPRPTAARPNRLGDSFPPASCSWGSSSRSSSCVSIESELSSMGRGSWVPGYVCDVLASPKCASRRSSCERAAGKGSHFSRF